VHGIPCGVTGDVGYDAVSPDHFVISVAGAGNGEVAQPEGDTNIVLTIDVSTSPGQFVFDTACFSQTLTSISMIDNDFPPVDHGPRGTGEVLFDKGIITIMPCVAGAKGDLDGNDLANPVDVIIAVNYVYRGNDSRVYPEGWSCPTDLGDANCDGVINPLDVTYYSMYVYKSEDALCTPCEYPPTPPPETCGK